jgi:hypothetical protein
MKMEIMIKLSIALIILISNISLAKEKEVDVNNPGWYKCTNNIPKICRGIKDDKEQFKCRLREFVKCNNKFMKEVDK